MTKLLIVEKQIRNFAISEFRNFILDLVLPRHCVGCAREQTWLCASCIEFIHPPRTFSCPFCNEPSGAGRTCPQHTDAALDGLIAAGHYHDPVLRKALHQFKYGYSEELGAKLGNLLARRALAYRTTLPENPILIPIPLTRSRLQRRGFNQTVLLAEWVARALGAPLCTAVLARVRQGEPQAQLEGHARSTNLADTLVVTDAHAIAGADCILIDDVSKTGATLEVASRVLKNAGAHSVFGLVLARG